MRVLSLFDGMSCGQIALNKLGYKNITYHASEIDKYAMSITQKNFPDTIQVGDVLKLKSEDFTDIDLMLAGSPCQGFSFAGKQLAFDDPRSQLFFEFVRLLKEIKPKYFLLENVRMKKEFLSIISEQVGVEPTLINSSKLSAQSRQRYYWTNIPFNKNIEDKGIVLKDILETNTDNKYNLSEEKKDRVLNAKRGKGYFYNRDSKKIGTVMALYHKDPTDGSYIEDHKPVKQTERNRRHLRRDDQKSLCMTATMWKGAGNNGMTLVETKPIKVGMNVEKVKVRKHEVDVIKLQKCILNHYEICGKSKKEIAKDLNDKYSTVEHYFRKVGSDFFAIPSDEHWIKLKEILNITTDEFDKQIMEFEYKDGVFESTQRVYSDQGKSPTLTASNKEQMIETKPKQVGTIKNGSQGDRIYSTEGKGITLSAQSGGTASNGNMLIQVGTAADINGHDLLKRIYSPKGKSPTLNAHGGGNTEPKVMINKLETKSQAIKSQYYKSSKANFERVGTFHATGVPLTKDTTQDVYWRKLTPLECERLQTVPDNYTEGVSNTQRYKMIGNGWTVDVIAHILKHM